MKWRSLSRVLCDHRIPIKLKDKFHKTTILLVMLHGIECWDFKKQYIHRMSVTERRMLR